MPVKNAGLYLEDCITSIKNQTESNWELIAVNDGSIDNSETILHRFSRADERIKYLNNKGSGIIEALKYGYAESQGILIHRMDADDLMVPKKLALLKARLLEVGKGKVVTGKVEYFAAEGLNDGYLKYQNWLNELCDQETHWRELFKECVIASPNWLIHKSDFEKCGAFNSDGYPEDYDLVFRMFQSGLQVATVDTITHLWRDHKERSSRNDDNYGAYTFFEIKLRYFLALKYDNIRPLMVWGAGKKGKDLAKKLKENDIP